MSVLDDFERMRLFRKQAAEFHSLADNVAAPSERRRYQSIARHYSELADREEQADRARMAQRLAELRLRRQQAADRINSRAASSGPANGNVAAPGLIFPRRPRV